jgi:hypothetical protein
MPYEIEPEHDLADLSESEVYEQVAQLAAERQLIQGLGVLGDDATVNAAAADLEVYCINVERQNQLLPWDKVERVRRELDKEREKHQSLTYRRRRVRISSDSEEDSPSDVTSDEERLDLYTQRQKKVVSDKAEELKRLLVEEAEAEKRRERLLQEKQQEQQKLAEVEARRRHMLLVRRRRLLMKQQLEAVIASHRTRGFYQVSAGSSSRSRQRLRVEGRRDLPSRARGGITEYEARVKAPEGSGKVKGSRVVLGELDVRAFSGTKSELI